MNHATSAVAPADAELFQVGDATALNLAGTTMPVKARRELLAWPRAMTS